MDHPGLLTVLRHPGDHPQDFARYALLAVLLVLMPALSFDFGITWDEHWQQTYGEQVFRYFASGFQDLAARNYRDLWLYGGLYDLICVSLQKIFTHMDPFDLRHVVNALFGWAAIAWGGMLGRRAFGPTAGLLAVILLALSPRFFGHCMNNPKDIPFAAFFLLALYFLAGAKRTYPYFNRSTALGAVIAIALAINMRVGGLLLVGFAGLQLAVLALMDLRSLTARRIAVLGAVFLLCTMATLVLGTVFWPWAQVNPFVRIPQALAEMSHFPWPGYNLFNGQWVKGTETPWEYVPVWIGVTSPLAVLAGLCFFPLLLRDKTRRGAALCLAFAACFPVLYVIVKHAVLYDGIRHMLFVVAIVTVVAAGGWSRGMEEIARLARARGFRAGACIAPACLCLLLLNPLIFHVKEHPNQVVFYNPLVGGPQGAFLRFEADCWGNSLKQAIDWVRTQGTKGKPAVFTTMLGSIEGVHYYARRFPEIRYIRRINPEHVRAEFFIVLTRTVPQTARQLLQQPNIVHQVDAAGMPLVLVFHNKAFMTP